MKWENKRALLSKEHVIYWLELFRDGNIDDDEFRDKFFSVFMKHIVIYEDRILAAFHLTGKEKSISLETVTDYVRIPVASVE